MRKGSQLSFVLFLCSVYAGATWSQTDDAYLKSITGEASELTLDSETKVSSKKSEIEKEVTFSSGDQGSPQAGARQELVSGLSLSEFEILLKENYMGSYLFYNRLDERWKQEVFSYYLENPDPAKLREKILQLNKK